MMQSWVRWRVSVMVLIYVIFFGHVAIWHHFGWTHIGHLGFGELFGALRTGLITAGTIFTLAVFLYSLVFGGVFCGWLCHWGILQDVAAGLLRRVGLPPRMLRVRSRLVPWIWFGIMLGQLGMAWYHSGLPTSMSVNLGATAVWSGVPRSIFQVGLTAIVSCFLIVFLFGERAFCRIICVFRVWFSGFETVAPWRVRRSTGCATCQNECSTVCPMGLDVSGELRASGTVRDSECIKCMECAAACPQHNVQGSFSATVSPQDMLPYTAPQPDLDARSTLFASLTAILAMLGGTMVIGGNMSLSLGFIGGLVLLRLAVQRRPSAFEAVVWPLLIAGLVFRIDPNDLTSLAKAVGTVVVFIVVARLFGEGGWYSFVCDELPRRPVPRGVIAVLAAVAILWGAHAARLGWMSAAIQGARAQKDYSGLSCMLEQYLPYEVDQALSLLELGKTRLAAGDLVHAEAALRESMAVRPDATTAHTLYLSLVAQNRGDDARQWLWAATASCAAPVLWRERARIEVARGNLPAAIESYQRVLTEDETDGPAHFALGQILMRQQRLPEAEGEFRRALPLVPQFATLALARCLAVSGRSAQAIPFFNEALRYQPADPTLHFDLAVACAQENRLADAIAAWERVVQLDPQCTEARDNIVRARARLAQFGAVAPLGRPSTTPGVASAPASESLRILGSPGFPLGAKVRYYCRVRRRPFGEENDLPCLERFGLFEVPVNL